MLSIEVSIYCYRIRVLEMWGPLEAKMLCFENPLEVREGAGLWKLLFSAANT